MDGPFTEHIIQYTSSTSSLHEPSVILTCMFLDGGRKLDEPTQAQGEHAEKPAPAGRFKPGAFLL